MAQTSVKPPFAGQVRRVARPTVAGFDETSGADERDPPRQPIRPTSRCLDPEPAISITGIVHTKNEARDIARAIESLRPLCDELLVADMGSSDRTVAIAEELGARVLHVPDFGYADPAWPLAIAEVRTRWALRIDADEVLPPTLAHRLRQIAEDDEADLVEIGRLNLMFGHPLTGSGWGPRTDRHLFFFKPRSLAVQTPDGTRVHAGLQPHEDARILRLPPSDELILWHFNIADWEHLVAKINRYTTIEAEEQVAGGVRPRLRRLALQIANQVRTRGLAGRSWRDGHRGLALVWLMVTYRVLVYVKTRQLAEVGDAEAIRRRYDAAARALADGATPPH